MREGLRFAFVFDDLYAVTLCGTFFSVMHFFALLFRCLREASRKEGDAKKCFLSCSVQHAFRKLVFQKIESSLGFVIAKHKWHKKKSRGFP